MTIEQLYKNYSLDTQDGMNARALLMQMHWYSTIATFDPRTGEALPQTLSEVLNKHANPEVQTHIKDRVWRITEHVRVSLQKLYHDLNESPRREQAILPLRAVRELDTSSFMALSRRPGRNVREKLAGKPYLQAVRRIQSIDLPENRLLKAFSERLAELLELRVSCLNEDADDLLPLIQSWLVSDEAKSIGRWENLSPNNTLLSHRHYRAIYDSWRWLQSLNDDLDRDFEKLEERQDVMLQWLELGRKYKEEKHLFAEMPVLFDYEAFELHAWTDAFMCVTGKPERPVTPQTTTSPVCIDLNDLYPNYAYMECIDKKSNIKIESYPYPLLWQNWFDKGKNISVDINLFNADAAYLHSDATLISSLDLFRGASHTPEHLERAARSFAEKIHETFKCSTNVLVWLQPDALNDFELESVRRNLNSFFSNADPLPRSVAAVFEKIKYEKLTDGYSVVVVDEASGKRCVTKLEAKYDEELKKQLPITLGYYWERHPSVILENPKQESISKNTEVEAFTFVSEQGIWTLAQTNERHFLFDKNLLRQDKRIGRFDDVIVIDNSPVCGGIRLYELQKLALEIPLWRNQIPELSIKVINKGRYQRFYLVSKGISIQPIRGHAINIDVNEEFTLPPGKMYYQFPLYIGDNEDEVGFSAKLESPIFPLNDYLTCRLRMTFTYGEDDPYRLVFVPQDNSYPSIVAHWTKTTEEIVTDAPSPEYPTPQSWEKLTKWKDAQGNYVNLLEWIINSLSRLNDLIPIPTQAIIQSNWRSKIDNNTGKEYWVASAITADGKRCSCDSRFFLKKTDENPSSVFPIGKKFVCSIINKRNWYSAVDITEDLTNFKISQNSKFRIISFREHSLQNRISYVWSDGRSYTDSNCPYDFRVRFEQLFSEILSKVPDDIIEGKMRFLQACLHKDTSDDCINWILKECGKKKIFDKRAIAFSLGNVSEGWQIEVFNKLLNNLSNDTLRVFSYAIWRDKDFINLFSLADLQNILNQLGEMLKKTTKCPPRKNEKDKWTIKNWIRSTAEPLELLLGLLRIRASTNKEKKMLLQPRQPIARKLADLVEHVAECVAESRVHLYSRVQLGDLPEKAEGDSTPDLIYALRLYLTGDVGANAIQITGVSEGEEED